MADSELFETEEGGEEVTLTIIDDGETETQVKETPKRKKKEMSPEQKARLLENLAKGRAKQAERRKKAQETKKLKQQLKDQEDEAELEALRQKVKAKSKPAEAKVKNPVPDEVAVSTEGKEGEKNNINEDYLKKLKEKDDELNKLKSYISTAQKKAQEWHAKQTKKEKPAPHKHDGPPTQERKRPPQTERKKPVYKYNFSTGRMEWC
jgi:hypothetical protein